MSAQDHAHDDHGAGEHDDHAAHDEHAHAEPPLPEPESPAWLPLLGGGLFLLALVGYLAVRTPDLEEEAAEAAAEAAAPAPRPSASVAERPRRPPAMRPERLREALDANGVRALPRPLPSR